jgi:NAD(P)-dependent dehydrogenase (short-subunit alcohol dehydrogenase family)
MQPLRCDSDNEWALILGASSGFGGACARKLAAAGFNVCGVHLDRKATQHMAEEVQAAIQAAGRRALFFNVNAAEAERRAEVVAALRQQSEGRPIRCLLHSLAFGTLKPYVGDDAIAQRQVEMTLDVMANSLIYWAQDLAKAGLLGRGSRVFAMTSAGSTRIWKTYGAVSAAKAALESHCRQLAVELAPLGVSVNALRAGVTDTPALRKIPGNEAMIAHAQKVNPWGRLTTPEDVAGALLVLCHPDAAFITGNVIGVDGGENNI